MNQMNKRAIGAMLSVSLFFNSQICFGEGIEQKLEIEDSLKFVQCKTFEEMYTPVQVLDIPKQRMVSRGLPRSANGAVKTYMSYRAITSKTSEQYKLQLNCVTDENGFRRYGEFYTVAMGQYYSQNVGDKFLITLSTGNQIKVMIGDVKQKKHTNDTWQYVEENGNMVEFIVDSKKISKLIKLTGDVSNAYGDILKGSIIKIEEIVE